MTHNFMNAIATAIVKTGAYDVPQTGLEDQGFSPFLKLMIALALFIAIGRLIFRKSKNNRR